MSSFRSIASDSSFAKEEEDVLVLWQKLDAFQRSVRERDGDTPENVYVFYDGPPFATGLPHYGHFVASTIKDVVPRYWTMRGKRVERRFGWDTHGLPIEMEMEKRLELSGPSSIREYGVDKFNEACRSNVLRYTAEWEKAVTRLGRWVDFQNDYKTMDLSFMESVWWVFEQLWKKGLIYQGVRVMPFSWRLSTPLSNFEANLDYREVDDPAITVALPIDGDPDGASLLIWTTTPWTLPSNLGVAVGPELDYVRAEKEGTTYVVAKDLVHQVLGDDIQVRAELKGKDLVGLTYAPLFDYFANEKDKGAFVVLASDHVTTSDGTGLVHMAPAYGEDDYKACQRVGIAPVDPVDEEGRFTALVRDFVGMNIKEADKPIIKKLKENGRLFRQATIRHSYPFCWRSGTPLIYKTFPVWFVRVEDQRDRMSTHNEAIHWVPEAVGQKRFGNWLKDARDWAISRNRFWGTPLPIWRCERDGTHLACLGSVQELEQRVGTAGIDDIHPHKIDHLTFPCTTCNGTMRRVPEVFDCWFESGAMPYAQSHYPFENEENFAKGFPAEFIAEGLDQTRGWFYTLLILSTALFDSAPFKNVIVNGLVLATTFEDKDGNRYATDEVDIRGGRAFLKVDGRELKVLSEKMSKSKRNYTDPMLVLDEHGADALRAYLINSPVVRGEPLKFSDADVRDVVRTVLLPLKNAWSFFVQYANIDGWSPTKDGSVAPPVAERPELDRWLLSVLQSLIRDVNREMEGYYLYQVVPPMLGFIDDLTNWYIRRSRRRFWRSADDAASRHDKACAYATLYETLVTFSKVLAPVMPFVTERIYQNLVVEPGAAHEGEDSVHLTRYPMVDESCIDADLEAKMQVVRQTVTLGRALREKHKLKTRQPLSSVIVVSHQDEARAAIVDHRDLIAEELNVKEVLVRADDDTLATLHFKANYKTLGKVMGKQMKEAALCIENLTAETWRSLESGGTVAVCGHDIGASDVLVHRSPRGDVVLETEGELTVALDAQISDDLLEEGLMREVVSRIQKSRKDNGLAVTDRIVVWADSPDLPLQRALDRFRDHIAAEVLATELHAERRAGAEPLDIDGQTLFLTIDRVS